MDWDRFKITDEDIANAGVIAAPDRLVGSAAQNKMVFDRPLRELVKPKHNNLVQNLKLLFNDLERKFFVELINENDAPSTAGGKTLQALSKGSFVYLRTSGTSFDIMPLVNVTVSQGATTYTFAVCHINETFSAKRLYQNAQGQWSWLDD